VKQRRFSHAPGSIVVALHFDEPAIAEELASWCEGAVVEGIDGPVVDVPTLDGPHPAALGDWVVRRGDGDFVACSPEEFAAHYAPADEASPFP
jgi:hypothetical protein